MYIKLHLTLLLATILITTAFDVTSDSFIIFKSHHRRNVRDTKRVAEDDDVDFPDNYQKVPKIYSMTIESTITNRYAKTVLTSKVQNLLSEAQEAVFAVIFPEKAFISKFVMNIDGKNYEAYVKKKEEAKAIYNQAVATGLGAAHVAASARYSNRFTVSVNIEPESKATFFLTYEQLLERKDGKYELVLNIQPRQLVKYLFVHVKINESLPLTFVNAPPIRSGKEISNLPGDLDPRARIEITNKTSASVTFQPSVRRQKELGNTLRGNEIEGLSGQFVVQYDVDRKQNGGVILLEDGYFVHFFAPPEIESLPKYVIFVLDTSGSMLGSKMDQLKTAMQQILSELKPNDKFSIIDFSSNVNVWDIEWSVTKSNIENAKQMINHLQPNGLTNIEGALKNALGLINIESRGPQPLIVFLTDGNATIEETNSVKLKAIVAENNRYDTPIFCLSFGKDANKKLLQQLSLKNNGFSRHIYDAADASLQLQDFFKHISSPLMSNIMFNYVSDAKDVTKTTFPIFFKGSEIVVAGKINKEFPSLPKVTAYGPKGPMEFEPKRMEPIGKLERLWAYLTVQQLLDKKEVAEDPKKVEERIWRIASTYSFVTPVSSLVVVKPNSPADNTVEVECGDMEFKDQSSNSRTRNFFMLPSVQTSRHPFPYFARPSYGSDEIASTYSFDWPVSSMGAFDVDGYGISAYNPSSYSRVEYSRPSYISEPRVHHSLASNIDQHYDSVDSMFPRFPINGYIYSTTEIPTTSTTTTATASTTTVPIIQIKTVDQLKQQVPWLNLTSSNDVMQTEKGSYKIDLFKRSPHGTICTITSRSGIGYCKLLHDCPEMLRLLTDVHVFEIFRCDLDGYAAICCPPPTPPTPSSTLFP